MTEVSIETNTVAVVIFKVKWQILVVVFLNEGIFVQLDELDELDKIIHGHYCLIQKYFVVSWKIRAKYFRKYFSVMVNVIHCYASDLGSNPSQICQFFKNVIDPI